MKKVAAWFLLIFLVSFLFSYLFEPFEVNRSEHKVNYVWICVIHSTIPLFVGLIYFFVLNRFGIDEPQWTLGKEALHLAVLLFLIGIGSFLVRDIIYDKPDNWSGRYFWEELRNTFLVGVLLLSFLLPLNLERLYRKYQSAADKLHFRPENQTSNDNIITIHTPIESEAFTLNLHNFLYAKVDGNYSDIFIKADTSVKKRLVRIPLKELQNQLHEYPFIFRSHRSYLVNTLHVQSVSGNAQGYVLALSVDAPEIPVSRSRIPAFDELFSTES